MIKPNALTKEVENYVTGEVLVGEILSVFLDAFIFMLALGILSERLNLPQIDIGYWSSFWVTVAAKCLVPPVLRVNSQLKQIIRRIYADN